MTVYVLFEGAGACGVRQVSFAWREGSLCELVLVRWLVLVFVGEECLRKEKEVGWMGETRSDNF